MLSLNYRIRYKDPFKLDNFLKEEYSIEILNHFENKINLPLSSNSSLEQWIIQEFGLPYKKPQVEILPNYNPIEKNKPILLSFIIKGFVK